MYINLFYVVRHKKIKANLTNSYFNFQRRLGRFTSVHFQVLMVKKTRYKHYCNRITIRENNNFQSRDQEESELDSAIIAKSDALTLVDNESKKSSFNKNNTTAIKNK